MNFRTLFAAVAAAVMLCGCGYRIGFIGHPQIKSMGVAPVTNETLSYNAAGVLRSLLCERIMNDGTYKLLRESQADCILYAKVLKVDYSERTWSSNNNHNAGEFFPEYYKVTATVEYSVVIPGRVKPLIGPAKVKGTAMFDHVIDLEHARNVAAKYALWDATKKIIDKCTETW